MIVIQYFSHHHRLPHFLHHHRFMLMSQHKYLAEENSIGVYLSVSPSLTHTDRFLLSTSLIIIWEGNPSYRQMHYQHRQCVHQHKPRKFFAPSTYPMMKPIAECSRWFFLLYRFIFFFNNISTIFLNKRYWHRYLAFVFSIFTQVLDNKNRTDYTIIAPSTIESVTAIASSPSTILDSGFVTVTKYLVSVSTLTSDLIFLPLAAIIITHNHHDSIGLGMNIWHGITVVLDIIVNIFYPSTLVWHIGHHRYKHNVLQISIGKCIRL